MQSVAIANPLIFSGLIDCSMWEERPDAPTTSVMKTLSLRIEERSLDNNDTEVRIELGNPSDLEFLYADGITKDKYKELANNWELDCPFEDCFRVALAPILKESGQPVQYKCSLLQNGSFCLFEIVAKQEYFSRKIPIKLFRVSGDSLIKHLAASKRKDQKKIAKLDRSQKEASAKLSSLEDELYKLKDEHEILLSNHNKMNEKMAKLEQEKLEAENEVELNQDTMDDMKDQMATLKEDNENLAADIAELNWIADKDKAAEEINTLRNEMSSLEQQNSSLKIKLTKLGDDLNKAKYVISKYCDVNGEAISVDGKKLQEMENAIYEKDEVIQQLTSALDSSTKKMEQKKVELEVVKKDLNAKDDRIMDLEKKLTLYRSTNSPLGASRMSFLTETTPKLSLIRPLRNITPSVTNNLPPPTDGVSSPKPSFRQSRVSTPTFDAFKKDSNAQK